MTIQAVNSAPSPNPTVLTRDGCYTIVSITIGAGSIESVKLPQGCLPGDGFEIYTDTASNDCYIFPPTSEDFGDPNLSTVNGIKVLSGTSGGNPSFIVRKLTSTRWGYIRS